jgi:predicted ester cyclase
MFPAANKARVRQYIEEVINQNNLDCLSDFVASDYIETGDLPGQLCGPHRARDHLLAVRETFPDLHLTIEQQVAEGDWVVTRVTARATHLGSWRSIKPTGKVVEISAVNVDKVVNGRIVEHGGAANMLEALLKAGVLRL